MDTARQVLLVCLKRIEYGVIASNNRSTNQLGIVNLGYDLQNTSRATFNLFHRFHVNHLSYSALLVASSFKRAANNYATYALLQQTVDEQLRLLLELLQQNRPTIICDELRARQDLLAVCSYNPILSLAVPWINGRAVDKLMASLESITTWATKNHFSVITHDGFQELFLAKMLNVTNGATRDLDVYSLRGELLELFPAHMSGGVGWDDRD
ncbi:MAG TPA: hypothetical protein VNG90_02615 [Candidatus Acidoferrum sp.]|nr:hypothetical protein [Candidatus Acidoferrum sp.]